jgi:hypothetical protein
MFQAASVNFIKSSNGSKQSNLTSALLLLSDNTGKEEQRLPTCCGQTVPFL